MRVALACLVLGCAARGALRPDGTPWPGECPGGALRVMRLLGINPGDEATVLIDPEQERDSPATLTEGPIESLTTRTLGVLPEGTRLYGRVWTSAANVTVRYDAVLGPSGDKLPFCGVARAYQGGMKKQEGSTPSTAVVESAHAVLETVDAFR